MFSTNVSSKPKMIVINGFAASGKTTLAAKYIADHPLSFLVDGDRLIVQIGAWLDNEKSAREAVFEYTKALADTQLALGHDVVLPVLLTNSLHADEYKEIAYRNTAEYYEIYIDQSREQAIRRLWERGTWGEEGLEPLGDHNNQEIEDLYDLMSSVAATRLQQKMKPIIGDVQATYDSLKAIVGG